MRLPTQGIRDCAGPAPLLECVVLRALVIIPARYESTRFPGKPLAPLRDKPLVQWVWSAARSAKLVNRVIVATDDARIQDAVAGFGGEAVMTPQDCPSGSDRAARVAAELDTDVVVNVQADEPLITGSSIDALIRAFSDPTVEVTTLREPFTTAGDLFDPNQVKVVSSPEGNALYFSRSPIPYLRGKGHLTSDFRTALFARPQACEGFWKHVGVYAYRRDVLLQFARIAPTPLESLESLEQLRLLETGRSIRVLDADFRSVGVDTPQELRRAAQALDERESKP